MSIIGSTARSDGSPRLFKIDVPAIECFFSGTGDMFSALMVVRMREAAIRANLTSIKSWVSPDDVKAAELPLAKAAEKVLGSMHIILMKTMESRDKELEGMGGPLGAMEKEKDSEKRIGLRRTKAAEVKVTRCLEDLRNPSLDWRAEALNTDSLETGKEAMSTGGNEGEARNDTGVREGLGLQHLAALRVNNRSDRSGAVDGTLPQNRD